jgi:site-specific recombinase XerD
MEIPKYIELYRKDLKLKAYSQNTIENYSSQIYLFLNFFNGKFTEPSKINEQAIKDWLLLAKTVNSMKHRISAVKLFYHFTIHQPKKFKNIEYPRSEKKLPIVLSKDEIQRMFDVCENLKHRVILSLLYSTGMRVSELINLKWSNIDRSLNIINIIAGKGNKDRQVMLSPNIIPLLIEYYRKYKTTKYVLEGQFKEVYSATSVRQVIKQLAEKAKISKRVYTHLIRHCSFTHLVENGIDINHIQRLAGHNNVKTTMGYLQISSNLIASIPSPINTITI